MHPLLIAIAAALLAGLAMSLGAALGCSDKVHGAAQEVLILKPDLIWRNFSRHNHTGSKKIWTDQLLR
jgi:hypothetical protein